MACVRIRRCRSGKGPLPRRPLPVGVARSTHVVTGGVGSGSDRHSPFSQADVVGASRLPRLVTPLASEPRAAAPTKATRVSDSKPPSGATSLPSPAQASPPPMPPARCETQSKRGSSYGGGSGSGGRGHHHRRHHHHHHQGRNIGQHQPIREASMIHEIAMSISTSWNRQGRATNILGYMVITFAHWGVKAAHLGGFFSSIPALFGRPTAGSVGTVRQLGWRAAAWRCA